LYNPCRRNGAWEPRVGACLGVIEESLKIMTLYNTWNIGQMRNIEKKEG
jgi:hypothetical protein